MRSTIATFLIFSFAAAACGSGAQQEAANDSLPADNTVVDEPAANTACYLKAVGKDTFRLKLVVNEEQVAGELRYDPHEKDKSSGTITGVLKDNILRASYSYQSEGMNSTRPVVFKVMGEQVYEALADNFDKNGIPVFSEVNDQLKFDPTPYNKKECE
ncbi:hypothetical protein [Chitinophaga cymbidii]|uniref:Lipoprotein n=1 Tax=Chitinophaga cymbidii TaxID=1096750 RepID=A0A512RNT4_9BACT|nr:hypothetical protein [Chitinophaga cymbidii]GEP97347.1 hypothetical protein CCY01nite_36070 [Chitinophaga cymbidii]